MQVPMVDVKDVALEGITRSGGAVNLKASCRAVQDLTASPQWSLCSVVTHSMLPCLAWTK